MRKLSFIFTILFTLWTFYIIFKYHKPFFQWVKVSSELSQTKESIKNQYLSIDSEMEKVERNSDYYNNINYYLDSLNRFKVELSQKSKVLDSIKTLDFENTIKFFRNNSQFTDFDSNYIEFILETESIIGKQEFLISEWENIARINSKLKIDYDSVSKLKESLLSEYKNDTIIKGKVSELWLEYTTNQIAFVKKYEQYQPFTEEKIGKYNIDLIELELNTLYSFKKLHLQNYIKTRDTFYEFYKRNSKKLEINY